MDMVTPVILWSNQALTKASRKVSGAPPAADTLPMRSRAKNLSMPSTHSLGSMSPKAPQAEVSPRRVSAFSGAEVSIP